MPASSSLTHVDTENRYLHASILKDSEALTPGLQESTISRFTVLLCGNANLESAELADILHVDGHLGRRKLNGLNKANLASVISTDVLWMSPKKYWTVSKSATCMQDVFLDVVYAYIADKRDVVIIAPKDYGWKNKNPRSDMHCFETPSRFVFCTRKLDLTNLVEDSKDEKLFSLAIAKALTICRATDRVGVRQSYQNQSSTNCVTQSYLGKVPKQTKTDADKSRSSGREAKTEQQQTERQSSKPKQDRRKDYKTDKDEYDLGDHTTNDDKPTAKPNYAKEFQKNKQKQGKKMEKGTDDCGDDVTAIDLDDTTPVAAFVNLNDVSTADSSNTSSIGSESEESNQKLFFSNIDELLTFVEKETFDETKIQSSFPTHKANEKRTSFKTHVMEIFGGFGGVTRIAIRRGLSVGKLFDLNVGIDLLKTSEKNKLLTYIDDHKPEVIVMGPPCTAFSGWARYNMTHAFEAWSRSYAIGYPLALLSAQVAKLQLKSGRHFLTENPWSSTIWFLPTWQEILPQCHVAYCEQCVFDLCDAAGEPTLKPTAFVASCEILVERLRQECNGRHARHAPLQGTLYGMSKTSYAQQWPPKLCQAIVLSIEKLCFLKNGTQQVYAGEASSSTSAPPSKCPGCRAHAYRRDPRHSRIEGECKFPHDTPDSLKCIACTRNLPSHHPTHTRITGECHWAEATTRLGSVRTRDTQTSRGPQPTRHVVEEATMEAPSAPSPPDTNLGKWRRIEELEIISALEEICYFDGWHEWDGNSKALVSTNTRYMREPQPRYTNSDFPLRSTYGQFIEHSHTHGNWYQLEDHVDYKDLDRYIGYPVERMVNIYHPSVASSSSTENKTGNQDQATADIDESQQTVRRVTIKDKPEVVEPREYGEDEVEIPEVSIGREAATKQDDETTETATPVDWSSMDLGTSFRELKSQDRSLVTRALRKLHLRWWHASNTKMHKLLEQAGAPQLALDLIKSVVDTCRICRSWKRPTAKSMSHVSQAQQFNEKVQLDLLFAGDEVILHLCDECTRFSVAELIKSRETSDILGAIKNSWIKYFNVPQLLVSDSEGALGSEEAAIWAERLGTSFKLLPRGAHATIVERHHETLRQLIHRISSQLKAERLSVNMTDIVAEAVRAKNSLLVINGFTPFQAVLGRTPNLLGESENPTVSMTADWVGGADSKHSTRLREIAVTAMVEGSAQERIKRAQTSQTRLAGEQLELAVNDLVDVYRTPRTKDNVGWRGPAKVVSIAGIEQGHVEVQWGSRVMSCRIQDIRKALMYPSMLQNDDHAFEVIRQHATSLSNNCETYGMICTSKGWQLSQAAAQRPHVFYAMLRVAHDVFQLPRCIGGRIGRGVAHTKGMYGTENSVLIWWPHNCPQLYRSMSCSAMTDLNLKELFGEDWINHCWVRFFGIDEANIEPVRRIGVDIPYLGGEPGDPRPHPSTHNPVTPIPMDEDDTLMTDHMSTAPSNSTRIVTPMSTDHGRPPPQPPRMPQRILRQATPVNTDRTRSRNVSTNNSSQPSTSSPVITTSTSNRGTTGTMTPQQIKSPRGDKRTPTISDNSQSSTKHIHKQQRTHNTPASSSNAPPPPQPDMTHEPLLPIDDDTDDDATIAQDEPETDLYTLLSPWNADELDGVDTWDGMFTTRHAPPQYHVWEAFPGVDELCAEQEHYLMRSTVTQTHQEMRRDTSQSDGPEIELGPGMAAWFVGMPKLEPDEILVFKTANKTTSPQIEKHYDALTAQDIRTHHKLVEEAIRKELSSFVEHKTFARAPRSQCGNICSSRWVLRWKEVDGQRCVKARLTIRGFEDLTDVPSYASTATRWTQRLVVSIAVQRKWSLYIADVSTAFLRGMSFQELANITDSPMREVAFTPPKGSEKYFAELKGFHDLNFSVEVLRLLKAVYGLRDAPRAWRLRLDMELRKLGGTPLPTDSSLYCFYSKSKELEALISTHVDDLKCCGTPERTKKILEDLTRAFGKLKVEHDNFIHCGLKHEKISDGYQVHQSHYAEQLRCIDTSSLDLAQPDKLLSEELRSAYLSLLGGLSWLIQTRLDIAIYVCALQRAASKATTGQVLKLNKLTKWVRRKQFMLVYRKITGKCKLLTISDSAFKTEPNSALAMRGAILGIGEEEHKDNGSIVHVLEFYARKQKRVCRSTFAAELNGIADAVEIARLINFTIACCYRPFTTPLELQQLEDNNQLPLAIEVYTDCRSVYDALAAEDVRTPTESSLVLILHVLKELLRSRLISKLTWVHTDDMLADGLTKGGVSRKALFTFSLSGRWKLKHECRSHSEKTQAFQKTIALALPQVMRQ